MPNNFFGQKLPKTTQIRLKLPENRVLLVMKIRNFSQLLGNSSGKKNKMGRIYFSPFFDRDVLLFRHPKSDFVLEFRVLKF